MDRNSITGIVLITLILIGFYFINKPSEEQLENIRKRQEQLQLEEVAKQQAQRTLQITADSIAQAAANNPLGVELDSLQNEKFGLIAPFIDGESSYQVLENELIKITFTNKGARIYSVELKNHKTFDDKPLILFDGNDNKFGFPFTHNTRVFNTNDLYFNLKLQNDTSIVYELASQAGESLSFIYELPKNEHMARFMVQTQKLGHLIATPRGSMDFFWDMKMPSFEKGRSFEQQYSGVFYKFFKDEVDWLKETKTSNEDLRTKVKWVSFKSQFFSSVFIAKDAFASGNISSTFIEDETSPFLKLNHAELAAPVDLTVDQKYEFSFYFGPNRFYTLNGYGKDLELNKLIPLGWGIFGWVNRYAVIPVFNYLERYISSYGIIILMLTLIIKLFLFPLTYKSYVSSAKMKVLKPQIDEINERISKDKALERQQATMALYKKAGVNPMGGCLPMLLQMPILIAMFRFFPASIELRQESFLWATDLSAYDSIFSLPFNIPFYGDHVSLFTLLMAITNVVYTKMNAEMTQSSNQLPGMKTMMYMMPVMFLFFFNSYASGLSYYYFISTLITIGQTVLIRQFVDEKQLLAKIHAHQKKPVVKSKFAMRLEEMAKQKNQQSSRKK
jgi:YidC/Oxa1 family membrane protein insertase